MEKNKNWFSNHNILICIVGLLVVLGSIGVFDNLIGRRYQKFYHNNYPRTVAIQEYKNACKGYDTKEEDEDGIEYCTFFDKQNEAINSFMRIAHSLDDKYANGKFRHCYLGNERIYQCYDKKKNLIAVRLHKQPAGWGCEVFYTIQLYIEK